MGKKIYKRKNRLADEKSPYLLQHADNPVDWYPWTQEAFSKALRENKPIFLSIGYSTCHWCHVMAHESFEDEEIAKLLNETFVCIKVDREERPDIDNVYMTVCQIMTGSGGWPLTIIMTPEKKPFFSATYIPKETRFGRIGLSELVPRIQQVWTHRQSEALESAQQVSAALVKTGGSESGRSLSERMLHEAFEQLQQAYDSRYGGFGEAPKFPTPHNILFLLRYWRRTGSKGALDMVERTLQKMRSGGIYDQIGFGFHRYSTDPRWLVPHFEKMLYDQALCAIAYVEAFQATGKEEYSQTAKEIFTYVLRDMQSPEGGFYSAEDADSEGEEGKFYLWTINDIKKILLKSEADLAIKAFNITDDGIYFDEASGRKAGKNILYPAKSLPELASDMNLPVKDLQSQLEAVREKLLASREFRVRPHKDDKILTDWNALMIAALAKGARVLDNNQCIKAAKRAYGFIMKKLRTDSGSLLHRYRDGEAAIPAGLDDYAFLIDALIELYEATFDVQYLHEALIMNEYLMKHFWDGKSGGFYFTADDAEQLITRQKEIYDGAVPSGNSVAMFNMLRLARITSDSNLEQKALEIGEAFSGVVEQQPRAFTRLMVAVDFAVGPAYEIIITGISREKGTREMITSLNKHFIPNKVVIFRAAEENTPEIDKISPFAIHHGIRDGKATAYVCLNFTCQQPTTDINAMLSLVSAQK